MASFNFNSTAHAPKKGAWRTYSEWCDLGWRVCEGEKATRKNDNGEFVFHESQVFFDQNYGNDPDDWDLQDEFHFIKNFPFME